MTASWFFVKRGWRLTRLLWFGFFVCWLCWVWIWVDAKHALCVMHISNGLSILYIGVLDFSTNTLQLRLVKSESALFSSTQSYTRPTCTSVCFGVLNLTFLPICDLKIGGSLKSNVCNKKFCTLSKQILFSHMLYSSMVLVA